VDREEREGGERKNEVSSSGCFIYIEITNIVRSCTKRDRMGQNWAGSLEGDGRKDRMLDEFGGGWKEG